MNFLIEHQSFIFDW